VVEVKVGFFLREALRALSRNAAPSFAAMATVVVTVLVLGVFIPVVQATTGAANEVRGKVIADVYLKTNATQKDRERVKRLIESTPDVGRVVFVSKEQAYAEERKRNPEAYDLLGSNPLPDTFRVTPTQPDDITTVRNALAPVGPSGQRTVADAAIDEVRNREEDTNKILSATRVVKLTIAGLAILLVIASVLLIANTIRLSLYARRRDVEVMKLVGATDWFIRWPFVIEGVLVGALGGVVAVLVLTVMKIALVDPLAADFALIAAPDTMNYGLLVAVLLLAAVGVSALGSGLSLRRFLRV
jgi:cell division transport system permease protein